MHLAQALTLLPEAKRTHWRLGNLLCLTVGLYLPRSFLRHQTITEPLPQIEQVLAIIIGSIANHGFDIPNFQFVIMDYRTQSFLNQLSVIE